MSIEISGAAELSRDLAAAAAAMPAAVRKVTEANGAHLVDLWRSNARATAGKHGRRYPSAITAETLLAFAGATVDVGPDSSKPQGGMGPGFEYGSVNQPPHLDGKKAADVIEPLFMAELEAFVSGLL
jgi:hypothetical protein